MGFAAAADARRHRYHAAESERKIGQQIEINSAEQVK
jgi:hypothetical protein